MSSEALVTHTVSSVINGVSQQPAHLRLDSHCELQENLLSSIRGGVRKRPPLEGVSALSISEDDVFFHIVEVDNDERYLLAVGDGTVKMWDLDTGATQTVSTPDGVGYITLSGSDVPKTSFKAVSIAGTTLLLNTKVSPAMAGNTTPAQKNHALIYCKQGGASDGSDDSDFKVIFHLRKDSPAYDDAHSYGSGASSAPHGAHQIIVQLRGIIQNRDGDGGDAGDELQAWNTTNGGLTFNGIDADGTSVWLYGEEADGGDSTYSDGLAKVTAVDPYGGTRLFVFQGTVKNFADLPARGPVGLRLEVVGEGDAEFDNYWVEFTDVKDGRVINAWVESAAPGIEYDLDPSTMPMILEKTGASTFTLREATWADRLVGDDDSAPLPSFIGEPIRDLTIFENRLIFLSGENIVGSEVGEYFNFFPTTVATVVDSDPIDTAGSTKKIAVWDYAIPYRSTLLLFSSAGGLQSRYGIKDQPLVPDTAPPKPVADYDAAEWVKPIVLGDRVFFLQNIGGSTRVMELLVDDNDNTKATPVTAHVPSYIPAGAEFLTGNDAEQTLVVSASDYDNPALFVYRYFADRQETLQASWSQWIFPFTSGSAVEFAAMVKSKLFVVIRHGASSRVLHQIDFGKTQDGTLENQNGEAVRCYLDGLDSATGVYDQATDTTSWTLSVGFAAGDRDEAVVVKDGADAAGGTIIDGATWVSTGQAFVASGDHSGYACFFGIPYTTKWQPNEPFVRSGRSEIGREPAVQTGTLLLQHGGVHVVDSGPFDVIVSFTEDDESFVYYGGRITLTGSLRGIQTSDERFPFDIGEKSQHVRISIESYDHRPFELVGWDWSGRFFAYTQSV